MDSVQEIKTKLSILDVVSEKVELRKAGRIWKGLCPWHKEKTPSFTVSPDREMCYCFGCHRGGDIFSFTQLTENVDFKESLEILAEKAGVQLRREAPEKISTRKQIFLANELAAKWFQFQLQETAVGKVAREYLARRGISQEAVRHFELGWAPDSWDSLLRYLHEQGLPESLLHQAGLIKQKDSGDPDGKIDNLESKARKYYDLFRARLMFPVKNRSGKVIAFSGRVLDDSLPKYVNSPETPLYRKQDELFYFSDAKKIITEKDFTLIVEGNVDVVASWEAGVENVVAPLGTALTQHQLEAILKLTKNLIFAFDSDNAGQKAAHKSVKLALQLGAHVKLIKIPSGSDPDDIVRSKGTQKWQEMVQGAQNWFEYFLAKLRREIGFDTPEKKRQVSEILLIFIKAVESLIEQEGYLDQLAHILGSTREVLRREMNRVREPGTIKISHPNLPKIQKTSADYFWGLLLTYPDLVQKCNLELDKIVFTDEKHQKFAELFSICYNSNAVCDLNKIGKTREGLSYEEKQYLEQNMYFVSEKYNNMNEKKVISEMKDLYKKMLHNSLKNTRAKLLIELEKAKREGDEKLIEKILRKLSESWGG